MGALIPLRDDLGLGEGYHSPQVAVDVRLNTNESPYPPPPGWRDDVRELVGSIPFNRYPDRSARALREGIAELHDVSAEHVFVGNGSNEVLQALCLAFGGPGRRAAVFEPTYALHSHIARTTATEVVEGERAADFTLDRAAARALLAEARPHITFLCSPNNPTGRVEPPEVVAEVVERAPGLVVVDEAYGQFASWSALGLTGDDSPVVVVRTFSKTWSMAAARLGYVVASPAVVAGMERVVLPYHLDALKQAAGRAALRYRSEMEARVKALVDERERLAGALAGLPVDTWPSEANFILFRPRTKPGGEVWQALVDRSVLVRNCSTWPRLDGCLRVTVGTPEEDDAFLAALREVL